MTSAAHRTLPLVNTYGIGPLTTHLTANQQQKQTSNSHNVDNIKQQPKYYLRDKYDNRSVPHQSGHSNSQTPRSVGHNQSNNRHYAHPSSTNKHPPSLPQQTLNPTTSVDQTVTAYHLLSASQANLLHPIQPIPNYPTKLSPSSRRRSVSHSGNSYESNSTARRNRPPVEMQKNKFSPMQAGASRPNYGNNNPTNGKYSQSQGTGNSSSDGRDSNAFKSRGSIQQPYSIHNYRRNHRDNFESEDNSPSFDENNQEFRSGHQSRGRASFPETTRQSNLSLPPVRRGQDPPYYTSNVSHPLAPGHPLRGRYRRNGGYSSDSHLSQHRNSDGRRGTIRSQNDAVDDDEEEGVNRNDERARDDDRSKQRSHSNVRGAQYSQQTLSTDSYLENQRRRAVRDSQGYYFPYKKYTLRDYKDLQKSGSQSNPFGSNNATDVDRKALVRKRMQYAAQIEKPSVDTTGEGQRSSRDINFRKPAYLNYGANHNPDKAAKRNRALEYVKTEVAKHRPTKPSKRENHRRDPTEEYINSLFPEVAEFHDDDDDDENVRRDQRYEVHTKTSQYGQNRDDELE